MAARSTAGEARAWGWVAHLRAGGTEPWHAWEGPAGAPGAGGDLHVLPGAQQLEVLRRLNQLGPTDRVLADRVLGQSAPGRGQPDLELVGADRGSRFGPRPVEPAELPAPELLRVAASLLAEDVASAGLPPAESAARPRPWRRGYRLLGDPELTDPVQRRLVAMGRPPRGRGETVVVLLDDLATTLADVWRARCFARGTMVWEHWLRALERRDELPPQVDPRALRAQLHESGFHGDLHVVLDRSALPALLGVRRDLPGPERPAAHVAELARWVASFLGLFVPAEEAGVLLRRTLRPWIAEDPGPGLAVPAPRQAWLRARAEALAADLAGAGYAVHGDPQALVPPAGAAASGATMTGPVRRESALDLALRTLRAGHGRPGAAPERLPDWDVGEDPEDDEPDERDEHGTEVGT
jgi:hypothetical protein